MKLLECALTSFTEMKIVSEISPVAALKAYFLQWKLIEIGEEKDKLLSASQDIQASIRAATLLA